MIVPGFLEALFILSQLALCHVEAIKRLPGHQPFTVHILISILCDQLGYSMRLFLHILGTWVYFRFVPVFKSADFSAD